MDAAPLYDPETVGRVVPPNPAVYTQLLRSWNALVEDFPQQPPMPGVETVPAGIGFDLEVKGWHAWMSAEPASAPVLTVTVVMGIDYFAADNANLPAAKAYGNELTVYPGGTGVIIAFMERANLDEPARPPRPDEDRERVSALRPVTPVDLAKLVYLIGGATTWDPDIPRPEVPDLAEASGWSKAMETALATRAVAPKTTVTTGPTRPLVPRNPAGPTSRADRPGL